MMPRVVVEIAVGRLCTLFPGDVVGRLCTAALPIDDARVSEAHALVSLRGEQLWLLGLRGGLRVGRRWTHEAVLLEGEHIGLAEDVELAVVSVTLPDQVVALDGAALNRPEWSLLEGHAVPGVVRDADAWLWGTGDAWRIQRRGEVAQELPLDAPFEVAGHRHVLSHQPVAQAEVAGTVSSGWTIPPMRIEVHDEFTVVQVEGRRPVELAGNAHMIVRSTARLAQSTSVHWSKVAAEIWRVNATEHNWFTNHRRLQQRLLRARLPPDLVGCRQGRVQLVLREGVDKLELLG